MQALRDEFIAERQQNLCEPRRARGCGGVADVALHCSQRAEADFGGAWRKGGDEAGRLDRVANARARAMRLEHLDGLAIDAGAVEDLTDELGLGGSRWCGDAIAAAILVHVAREDDAIDLVAIGNGAGQWFQYHHGGTFGRYDAIRTRSKAAALAGGREHTCPAHLLEWPLTQIERDAPGNCQVDLASPNGLGREMYGDEGG